MKVYMEWAEIAKEEPIYNPNLCKPYQ